MLYDDEKIGLAEIWAEDWLVIQAITLEEAKYKRELNASRQRLSDMKNEFGL